MRNFGQLLRDAIEACHMTTTGFSRESGILRNLLSRMLRDEAYPSVESFARIHAIIKAKLPNEEANALIDAMMEAVRTDPRFQERRERRSKMGALRYERAHKPKQSRSRQVMPIS